MDMPVSLGVAGALLVVAVVCGILGARPYDPMKGPRMVPYGPIMLLTVTFLVVTIVHIASLLGILGG